MHLRREGETLVIGTERHAIRTPEQVVIEYRIAGLGSRSIAWLIDQVLMLAGLIIAGQFLSRLPGPARVAVEYIALFAVQIGYAMVFEALWDGQTPGKRLLGIRVIDARGFSVSPVSVLVRNVVRALDFLPIAYGIGGMAALLDPLGRRVGDLAAGTIVVSERHPAIPRRVAEGFSRPNSLDRPEIRTRALRRIPPALREYILSLLLRRDRLDDDARIDLFERTADLLARRLEIPRESFLSGERLVEDVAAILYARRSTPLGSAPDPSGSPDSASARARNASMSDGSGASKTSRRPIG